VNAVPIPADAHWPLARRLVVLVPASLQDETALAAQIYQVAHARGIGVLYLGLAARPEDELDMRRRLALVAAYTRDNALVQSAYRLVVGGDWLTALRLSRKPGDLVVCHREQRHWQIWRPAPLADVLARQLQAPVMVLDNLSASEMSPLSRPVRVMLFWLGTAALLACFFWAQVSVQRLARDWAQNVLLAGLVALEFVLLAAWNRWLQ
jgi:hypothetical protein